MRYSLVLNSREPGEGEIAPDAVTAMQEAFGAYGRALESAGVLVAAEVLQRSDMTTTVTVRDGAVQMQDGPFAETKEGLVGVFVIDVPPSGRGPRLGGEVPGRHVRSRRGPTRRDLVGRRRLDLSGTCRDRRARISSRRGPGRRRVCCARLIRARPGPAGGADEGHRRRRGCPRRCSRTRPEDVARGRRSPLPRGVAAHRRPEPSQGPLEVRGHPHRSHPRPGKTCRRISRRGRP